MICQNKLECLLLASILDYSCSPSLVGKHWAVLKRTNTVAYFFLSISYKEKDV